MNARQATACAATEKYLHMHGYDYEIVTNKGYGCDFVAKLDSGNLMFIKSFLEDEPGFTEEPLTQEMRKEIEQGMIKYQIDNPPDGSSRLYICCAQVFWINGTHGVLKFSGPSELADEE